MTFKPSVLIFGVGPRTGTFIADKFAGAGYQVAATGRSVEDGPLSDGYLNVKADLTNPAVVPDVFAKVKAHLGTPPNVVVCNGTRPDIPSGTLKLFLPSDPESSLESPSPISGRPTG
jgi:NAD(P)-dependent dehydrogenase (short-subunit alcohol dehydrogenase family)